MGSYTMSKLMVRNLVCNLEPLSSVRTQPESPMIAIQRNFAMDGTDDTSLRRILFVEDDPDIQTVAKMALEALGGFTVLACSSGAEALAAVDGFVPDLVLLDVMMPGMDGPATLAALRERPV